MTMTSRWHHARTSSRRTPTCALEPTGSIPTTKIRFWFIATWWPTVAAGRRSTATPSRTTPISTTIPTPSPPVLAGRQATQTFPFRRARRGTRTRLARWNSTFGGRSERMSFWSRRTSTIGLCASLAAEAWRLSTREASRVEISRTWRRAARESRRFVSSGSHVVHASRPWARFIASMDQPFGATQHTTPVTTTSRHITRWMCRIREEPSS